jgi:hypothetical protein
MLWVRVTTGRRVTTDTGHGGTEVVPVRPGAVISKTFLIANTFTR